MRNVYFHGSESLAPMDDLFLTSTEVKTRREAMLWGLFLWGYGSPCGTNKSLYPVAGGDRTTTGGRRSPKNCGHGTLPESFVSGGGGNSTPWNRTQNKSIHSIIRNKLMDSAYRHSGHEQRPAAINAVSCARSGAGSLAAIFVCHLGRRGGGSCGCDLLGVSWLSARRADRYRCRDCSCFSGCLFMYKIRCRKVDKFSKINKIQ